MNYNSQHLQKCKFFMPGKDCVAVDGDGHTGEQGALAPYLKAQALFAAVADAGPVGVDDKVVGRQAADGVAVAGKLQVDRFFLCKSCISSHKNCGILMVRLLFNVFGGVITSSRCSL